MGKKIIQHSSFCVNVTQFQHSMHNTNTDHNYYFLDNVFEMYVWETNGHNTL